MSKITADKQQLDIMSRSTVEGHGSICMQSDFNIEDEESTWLNTDFDIEGDLFEARF